METLLSEFERELSGHSRVGDDRDPECDGLVHRVN